MPSGTAALSLANNSAVTVSDLAIEVASAGTSGLELDGARATRVDVHVVGGADGATGVVLRNGASFRNGSITVGANAVGLAATIGTSSIDSSLLRLGAAPAGLLVESPAGQDVTLNARHVTVSGNGTSTQDGARVVASSPGETASLNLRNSILHQLGHPLNRAASGGATAQVAVEHSNFDPSTVVSSGSGGVATNAVLDASPGFVDDTNGDYRLAAGSPLIDAGEPGGLTSVEPTEDLAGVSRLLNGDPDCVPRRDIGAHEFLAPAVFVSPAASPRSVLTGQPASFDGSQSCDPYPTAALSYSWRFDDGGSGSGRTIQHAFATPGGHTATLRVTSSTGRSGEAAASIAVALPPSTIGSTPPFSRSRLRPPVLIARRAITVSQQGIAQIPLQCAGAARCVGRIALVTLRPVRLSARMRIQKLGAARFSIRAGRTTRVKVRLSKPKLRLIRKLRKLAARATVTDRDSAGRTRKVTRTVVLRAR